MAKWINDPKKLVVLTQRMENYGDAENPNWKIQDGETYVVEDIFEDFEPRVETFYLPEVKELVEYSNDSRKEYIISYRLEEEDVEVCEPGVAPIKLMMTGTDDLDKNVYWGWAAHRLTENTNGYMRTDIQAKQEHWTPLPGGVKKDYLVKHWDWDGEDIFDLCSRTKLVLPA
jgi:hypothetical protein